MGPRTFVTKSWLFTPRHALKKTLGRKNSIVWVFFFSQVLLSHESGLFLLISESLWQIWDPWKPNCNIQKLTSLACTLTSPSFFSEFEIVEKTLSQHPCFFLKMAVVAKKAEASFRSWMTFMRRKCRNKISDNDTVCCVGVLGKTWTKFCHRRSLRHLLSPTPSLKGKTSQKRALFRPSALLLGLFGIKIQFFCPNFGFNPKNM